MAFIHPQIWQITQIEEKKSAKSAQSVDNIFHIGNCCSRWVFPPQLYCGVGSSTADETPDVKRVLRYCEKKTSALRKLEY
jgi:hypothetical protein